MSNQDCTLYLIVTLAIPVWVVSIVYLREVLKDCDRRRDRRLRQQEARDNERSKRSKQCRTLTDIVG